MTDKARRRACGGKLPLPIVVPLVSYHYNAAAGYKACFGLTFTDLLLYCAKKWTCRLFLKCTVFLMAWNFFMLWTCKAHSLCITHFTIDFLGNRRSAVLRRIFCAVKSVSSAALLGVMQGRDTSLGAEETSKTVLRKFPRKSIQQKHRCCYFSRNVSSTGLWSL